METCHRRRHLQFQNVERRPRWGPTAPSRTGVRSSGGPRTAGTRPGPRECSRCSRRSRTRKSHFGARRSSRRRTPTACGFRTVPGGGGSAPWPTAAPTSTPIWPLSSTACPFCLFPFDSGSRIAVPSAWWHNTRHEKKASLSKTIPLDTIANSILIHLRHSWQRFRKKSTCCSLETFEVMVHGLRPLADAHEHTLFWSRRHFGIPLKDGIRRRTGLQLGRFFDSGILHQRPVFLESLLQHFSLKKSNTSYIVFVVKILSTYLLAKVEREGKGGWGWGAVG